MRTFVNLSNPLRLNAFFCSWRLESMPFRVGQRLWIACDVKQGMSPAERSIRFEFSAHEKRILSGFVPERFVKPGTKRSEEHTSELQSHVNLVCRLLLEKKKK